MRVEAVGAVPEKTGGASVVDGDASVALAIKSFLAAVDSDDSLFCVAQALAGPYTNKSSSGFVCSGEMALKFRESGNSSNRSLHFLLIEKLIELLKEAGSQETLEATICLTSSAGAGIAERANQKELAIWIRLSAKADTPEKAVLRWGLGLAHLQQALLFTSRHLRMHLGQASG
ncbi:MAG TPA: hypothetical protein VGI46_16290 [Candidatus Acidoferrum sp.]|jgi:hypothetical protein